MILIRRSPRTLLIASLWLSPLAHGDYDFSDPKYRVQNPPESSRDSTDPAADRDRAEMNRAQAIESNRQQHVWSVIHNGQEIPFDEYVREHPIHYNNYRNNSYNSSSGSGFYTGGTGTPSSPSNSNTTITPVNNLNTMPGITPAVAPPPAPRVQESMTWLHILSVFLIMGVIGYLLYRRFYQPLLTPSVPRSPHRPVDRPSASAAPRAATRPVAHPAGQSGWLDVPASVSSAIAPTQQLHPAEKPIEFIRPSAYEVPTAQTSSATAHAEGYPRAFNIKAQDANENDQILAVLDGFAAGTPVDTMLYAKQLRTVRLDYSAASLDRVDQFIAQLRDKTQPVYSDYMADPAAINLLNFIGLYVATTIARLTQQTIRWYDIDSQRRVLDNPDLENSVENAYMCVLGQDISYRPVGLIINILFDPTSKNSCSGYLARKQETAQSYTPILSSVLAQPVSPQGSAEQAWFEALEISGGFVKNIIRHYSAGDTSPNILYPSTGKPLDNSTLRSREAYDRLLRDNPDRCPFITLAFDNIAYLPSGRCNAICLTIHAYGNHPAQWTIMVPYRSSQHPEGFALYTPILAESSLAAQYTDLILYAFYNGVNPKADASDAWQKYLKEV
jgi:hypothetical protein